jgi:methyl-accepting chemotaxis protein
MTALLVTLTVLEIVALVAVLAAFLLVVAGRLRTISTTLAHVTWGVRAVEQHADDIAGGLRELNWSLEQLAAEAEQVAREAEDSVSGQARR